MTTPAQQSPAPGPLPRRVALTPMRQKTARSLRRLADDSQAAHPEMITHQHLRDAAAQLDRGNEDGAKRHLRAAMFSLTPQSLMRHGIHTDEGHVHARQAMHGTLRHYHLIGDIEDAGAQNRARLSRLGAGDAQTSPVTQASAIRPDPDAGYGPGALAARPAQRPGRPAGPNAPAKIPTGGTDEAAARPQGKQPAGSKQFSASTWDDLAGVLTDLSAETGRLATTPQPHGRPGGPGLYGVKGQKHSDYFEHVVGALMRKRGMDQARASKIAWGALRKWRSGRGHVHPEVRAAATGALAEEATKHGSHHAVSWDELDVVLELAGTAAGAAQDTHSAKTGQFAKTGQDGKKQAKGKPPAKTAPKASPAQQKAKLLATAKTDKAKAAGIARQIAALQKIIAAAQAGTGKTIKASSNVTKATAGSTTAASASTKAAAAAGKTASATASATATLAGAKKALPGLQSQYAQLVKAANAAAAQAAKL